mgnify:CR=1 FL=1
MLPVVGVGSALYGLYLGASSGPAGWYWVGAGVALIIADMVLDWLWARSAGSKSDEPDLNRRGAELVGQTVIVVEAIEPGARGTVRAADTVWAAEGCPAAPGARVRVTGVDENGHEFRAEGECVNRLMVFLNENLCGWNSLVRWDVDGDE